jgi:hypothetical protein
MQVVKRHCTGVPELMGKCIGQESQNMSFRGAVTYCQEELDRPGSLFEEYPEYRKFTFKKYLQAKK